MTERLTVLRTFVGGEYVDDVSPRYFNNRKTTIYGGSSEVQRGIMAKAMLGL